MLETFLQGTNDTCEEHCPAIFVPTVSFRALNRAMGTLSFFLQIQLPVFRRNMDDAWPTLPLLYFSEMTIYHLDEVNEDSAAGKGIGVEGFGETMDVLARILIANGAYDERVRETLANGMAYWRQELQLCKNLNDGTPVTPGEAEQALRNKSFDLALMRQLLRIGLPADDTFVQTDKVLTSFDYWAEVLDDYYDYEKDERNKSFSLVRCLRLSVPKSELAHALLRHASSAFDTAAKLANSMPPDVNNHLKKHMETFMAPDDAVKMIMAHTQATLQSPDQDTEFYGSTALSEPVFSFSNFICAFDLMQRVSQCALSPIGLSFETFTCRAKNSVFFLSSLLVSNWDVLSPSTQRNGILELQRLHGHNFSDCFVDGKNSTPFFDLRFVLQNLLSARKCEETAHNNAWCKHGKA
jgi:hypothetical protein